MTFLVPIALFGYVPICILVFALLRPRTAVIVCMLVGWLFLPVTGFKLPGLPDYTKHSAIAVSCLVAALFFDPKALFRFRPHWIDLPVLIWCLVPIASSVTNGLGLYDGMSESLTQIMRWGMPYFLGRLYFADAASLRALGIAIVAISLFYLVLCLWEMRFSPQLHRMLYGFHPTDFRQQMRWGGFRPMVFIGHGLGIAKWYTVALLWAAWLWRSHSVKRIALVPVGLTVGLMIVGLFVSRAVSGLALAGAGLATIWLVYMRRGTWPVLLLCLLPMGYIAGRCADIFPVEPLISAASAISEERAQSLQFRIDNEDILIEKAMRRPVFGWAGWGRSRVYDANGKDVSITDGLWVIALGKNGLVGVTSLMLVFLLPTWLTARRLPGALWGHPLHGAAGAAAMTLLLVAINALPNAPYDPVTAAMAGGLAGLVQQLRPTRPLQKTPTRRGPPVRASHQPLGR